MYFQRKKRASEGKQTEMRQRVEDGAEQAALCSHRDTGRRGDGEEEHCLYLIEDGE